MKRFLLIMAFLLVAIAVWLPKVAIADANYSNPPKITSITPAADYFVENSLITIKFKCDVIASKCRFLSDLPVFDTTCASFEEVGSQVSGECTPGTEETIRLFAKRVAPPIEFAVANDFTDGPTQSVSQRLRVVADNEVSGYGLIVYRGKAWAEIANTTTSSQSGDAIIHLATGAMSGIEEVSKEYSFTTSYTVGPKSSAVSNPIDISELPVGYYFASVEINGAIHYVDDVRVTAPTKIFIPFVTED